MKLTKNESLLIELYFKIKVGYDMIPYGKSIFPNYGDYYHALYYFYEFISLNIDKLRDSIINDLINNGVRSMGTTQTQYNDEFRKTPQEFFTSAFQILYQDWERYYFKGYHAQWRINEPTKLPIHDIEKELIDFFHDNPKFSKKLRLTEEELCLFMGRIDVYPDEYQKRIIEQFKKHVSGLVSEPVEPVGASATAPVQIKSVSAL